MSVRNVYLDCEFLPADPHTGGLISIGLTDDQGVDYYAVNCDFHIFTAEKIPWMVENVLPHLPVEELAGGFTFTSSENVRTIERIRDDIAAYFADTDATETHLYAYYGGQDICRLHSLWDNDWSVMPDQIPRWFFDIKALAVQAGCPELPSQDGSEHHALADARYNRTMHQHLLTLTKETRSA
jgi:hypothetical protein